MDRKELFESFKKCFPGYDEAHGFKVGEDDSWIFAVVDSQDNDREGFHYELVARGSYEFYIELHFELYKYQWPDMRIALIKVLNQEMYRREIIATSYYSSLIWRVRRPVFNGGDIPKALFWLRKAVGEAAAQAKESVNVKRAEVVERVSSDVEMKSAALILPGPCSIAVIAQMLIEGAKDENTQDKKCNLLVIPSVQRGKVWNAARIETLWDSIFRNIPIGALSIRNRKNESTANAYDLLDGQQRATAIALGYDRFPDMSRKYESILWIDLKKIDDKDEDDRDKRYSFFVTTASQPWGYADSNNETKNNLLPEWEKREASKAVPDAQWEEGQVKPYPFQLFPVRAKLPVPYTLLREYAESAANNGSVNFNAFLEFLNVKNLNKCLLCKLGAVGDCHDCIRLSVGNNTSVDDSEFGKLCEKVVNISKDYKVFLLDASSVAENDIALYFTRIGKGGVVPSDEELAYSVLKSKLGPDFRETIQLIHNDYGLASESRIAHLAIRLFKSESNEEKSSKLQFYSGSVFSAAMDMCTEENATKKQAFAEFIIEKFKNRVGRVMEKYQLTQWHSARYASERNGDVFLLLLLAAGRDDLLVGYDIKGLAELLFGYASHVDYSVRKIFEEGVPIALANLAKETYYGKPKLTLPIPPEKFGDIDEERIDSSEFLLKWKDINPEAARTIAEGYYNSSYDHAFNILLYACRKSIKNNQFKYDKNLGLWAEDNCPWDYDHIMPHSIIEKMADSTDKTVCEWLKNSIGNLAPLPFSLNRSWSDDARDASYPCSDAKEQSALCINGDAVKSMWNNDGQISPLHFCKMVIARYKQMYKIWYDDMGFKKMLDFRAALEVESPTQAVWRAAKRRYLIFTQVAHSLPDLTFKRIVADNKESEISESERHKEFCSDQVITLSKDVNGVSVALSKCGIRGAWEIGLRKCSVDSATTKSIYEKIKEALPFSGIDNNKLCNEGERWWYWYEELSDRDWIDVLGSNLSKRLDTLLEFAEKLLERSK